MEEVKLKGLMKRDQTVIVKDLDLSCMRIWCWTENVVL